LFLHSCFQLLLALLGLNIREELVQGVEAGRRVATSTVEVVEARALVMSLDFLLGFIMECT
jgi:hypothetical protein